MTRTRTTRYVTLLSVVLALALTVALAACGSDEPSGVTGPGGTADAPLPTLGPTSAETDREALVAFYNATDGKNWDESDTWLSDAPLGAWEGVTTNYSDGRVIELDLGEKALSGEIPPELGSLSNLRELDLNYNDLSGEIPAWLGSLSNLELLDLSGNALYGGIPAELGSLSNLRELDLNYTALSGEIPAELGSLSNLTYLSLSGSGEIPAELGNLSNLRELDLSYNGFSGEIPAELGNLSNLQYLDLHDTDFSGCVPSSLEDQLVHGLTDLGGLSFC